MGCALCPLVVLLMAMGLLQAAAVAATIKHACAAGVCVCVTAAEAVMTRRQL